MEYQLPKPKNWQDFESICHELWRSIWGDRNAQKNGRQGQAQGGVDIYGYPTYALGLHAVQCKGKNDNYDSQLTQDEIDAECIKAKTFSPDVKNYIIATTGPRDTKLQKHCIELNANQTFPFPVSVWSWDDIEPEIAARENLLKSHYSNLKNVIEPSNEFIVDINSTQDKIAAFLTRPSIQNSLSQDLLNLIYPLLYEMIDNAFLHGHAGYCKIVINDNVISLIDNGSEYDTSLLHTQNGRQGVSAMKFVMSELGENFHVSYKRDADNNVTSLIFCKDILKKPLYEILEVTFPDSLSFGREVAKRQAEYDFKGIPAYKKRIVINVVDKMTFGASFVAEYFAGICRLLNSDQSVVVYLPANTPYIDNVKEELKDFPIEFVLRK